MASAWTWDAALHIFRAKAAIGPVAGFGVSACLWPIRFGVGFFSCGAKPFMKLFLGSIRETP